MNLVPLKNKIAAVAREVDTLEIKNDKDLEKAVVVLSQMNKYKDQVQEKRETITKPLNEALKNARAMFNPLEALYEGSIELLRKKMTVFQTEAVKVRKEAELKIAERVKAGTGNLSVETAIKKIDELKVVEKEIATEAGLVSFVEVKKFEVIDIKLLPIEFHLPNEIEIKKVMKEGKELPGVRYFTEQMPRNYR